MVRRYDPSEIPSVHNLADSPIAKEGLGFEQVVFRGVDQMVGMTTIGPEREDKPQHSHPWEQMTVVIEGEVDFLVDGERVSLGIHDAVEIPPEVPHASRAVSEDPARLLAFWPLREDRLDATDYQTEFDV
ncbi:pectin degradation protein [Halorubrum sp. Ea1]|uniref:cupin domain-containing protein n=1 Tax=Halorubrum sp. Ea1 TaxID=1480718 RepID=UPI000B990EA3|nr:cupin domain-containing protein [Halorubrum sp. Ea1]OYR51934.1 pectin degradation protein [Halorubrum sp. Ea1]